MASILESCEKYFGTRDFYQILGIEKGSLEKDIKKAYYKLALAIHPDRVSTNAKEEATEKFKIISHIHSVLTDPAKRTLYDEQGVVGSDNSSVGFNWTAFWAEFGSNSSAFMSTVNLLNVNYGDEDNEEDDPDYVLPAAKKKRKRKKRSANPAKLRVKGGMVAKK